MLSSSRRLQVLALKHNPPDLGKLRTFKFKLTLIEAAIPAKTSRSATSARGSCTSTATKRILLLPSTNALQPWKSRGGVFTTSSTFWSPSMFSLAKPRTSTSGEACLRFSSQLRRLERNWRLGSRCSLLPEESRSRLASYAKVSFGSS